MAFQWLFLISIAAGFVGAMSGMGGGVVLIPALTLLRMDIKHAIAISIVSVIATSSGAASAYVRDRITNLKVGMFLEMFTIVGAGRGRHYPGCRSKHLVHRLWAGAPVLLAGAVPSAASAVAARRPAGRLFPLAGTRRQLLRPGHAADRPL